MKSLKQYLINESINSQSSEWPDVKSLGYGEFDGILWGSCFLYENKKYYSEIAWRNMFPSYCKMIIDEKKAFPVQVDKYQRSELKELFK